MSIIIKSEKGGGFGIILMGIAIIALALLIFVNAVDYALYSYKRNIISTAIDYSVSAAIQQIDMENSKDALAESYDENTGMKLTSTDGICIDETNADNAFYSTLQANTGISKAAIANYAMIVIVNPTSTAMEYIVKKGISRDEGSIIDPNELENVINTHVGQYLDVATPEGDNERIFVNGNPKTNGFEKRPYYIVIIQNYEIDGLFKKRNATFVGFKGAKIERKK